MEDKVVLDLIENAKNGCEKSFIELVSRYENMGALFNKVQIDVEEKSQVIKMAIHSAVVKYEPKKLKKFSTHLWQYLRWYILEQDSINRTGKSVDPLVFSGAPNLKKLLGDEEKVKKLHNALVDYNIIKENFKSKDKSLKMFENIMNDINFCRDNFKLFVKEKMSIPIQKDLEYYEKICNGVVKKHKIFPRYEKYRTELNKIFENFGPDELLLKSNLTMNEIENILPSTCPETLLKIIKKTITKPKLNDCAKKRIEKLNFYLLNFISPFCSENEFALHFENEFPEGTINKIEHNGVCFEYNIFYEGGLFGGLEPNENFIIQFLYNHDVGIKELYCEFSKFKKMPYGEFKEKIHYEHKDATFIEFKKKGHTPKKIGGDTNNYKTLSKLFNEPIRSIGMYEERAMKKIKENATKMGLMEKE